MPVLAPVFREINHSRILKLHNAGYSANSVASVINDETNNEFRLTATDVKSYIKVNKAASARMLITKNGLNSLMDTLTDPIPA